MKTITQVVQLIRNFIYREDDSIRGLIAPVEPDRRAESDYSQNDILIWEDKLYIALTDIHIGDDFITYESEEEDPNIKLAGTLSDIFARKSN